MVTAWWDLGGGGGEGSAGNNDDALITYVCVDKGVRKEGIYKEILMIMVIMNILLNDYNGIHDVVVVDVVGLF